VKYRFLVLCFFLYSCDSSNDDAIQPPSELTNIQLIEEVKAEAGKIVIPYKKYQLKNGLTLILHEDHSDPLVHVDVTYHVGSAREETGKSGFAHFFEHMMFQGSENVADEQHFKIITEVGGTLNGSTNQDRTNYFETVPANQLEKMLWLESDRMGFFLDAVTQKKFEVQRETVKNERGQRIDNRPYGRLDERVSAALYPSGHPYSWPVIGFMEDLDRANLNDLKSFFLKWYGPNNATLTIGGDIDVKETLSLVNKYFSTIPKGPEINPVKKEKVILESDRYISMEDNVHLPLIYMAFPTVPVRDKDEAPLDLLAEILGGGKTSLFYKNLIKNQFAVDASVNHPCSELVCTFNLYALPHPSSNKSLADIEKIMRDTFVEFEKRGVETDDLVKAKAQMESSFIFGLQSVRGKVSQLASNQVFTANPNYIEKDIERYSRVTKKDVERVFQQYIKGKSAVIMSVVPHGKLNMIANKDNFKWQDFVANRLSNKDSQEKKLALDSENKVLSLRKSVDTFDRSIIPKTKSNRSVELPQMWQQERINGIKILGTQSLETPTTSILIKIPAGHYYERKDKAGTSSLLAHMLNESTTKRTAESMSKALQLLGSNVSISSDNQSLNISINALSKNIVPTILLVKEKLFDSAFLIDNFIRNKKNIIENIVNNKKDAGYLASTAYRQLLNGKNIIAMPRLGTEKTVLNIQLKDVKDFYNSFVKPQDSEVVIVSDLTEKQLESVMVHFDGWKGKANRLILKADKSSAKKGVVYLVNKDGAAQSAIRIGKRGLKLDITGEFYRSKLMNFPLGGAFNSRINLNLREDKSYTYGARSYFWGNKYIGGFTASAEVRSDVTDKAIIEFVKEIKGFHTNGITQEELQFMKDAINQSEALKYETPNAKLSFLSQILEHQLTVAFVSKQSHIVKNITMSEINRLAKKHLKLEEMVIVVVGDAKVLKPQLTAIGYEVIDYLVD